MFARDAPCKMQTRSPSNNFPEEAVMCIEKLVRNFGFALAAGVVIFGVGFTFEYLPVLSALAH